MNIAILGGAGFIGTNFNYSNKSCEITNFDNGRLATGYVEYEYIDLFQCSCSDLVKTLSKFDAVINLAAITRVIESLEDPYHVNMYNIAIQAKVLEAQRILQSEYEKKLISIFISTGGAIAGNTLDVINEDHASPISVYGASKLSSEILTKSYVASFGIDARILRLTNVFGQFCDKKESVIAKFSKQILKNEKIVIRGDGEMSRDYIHVSDVCSAIRQCLIHGIAGETYLIGSGETVTLNGLIRVFERLTGSVKYEYSQRILGEVDAVRCDVRKATQKLNWIPTVNFNEGVKDTYEYLKQLL